MDSGAAAPTLGGATHKARNGALLFGAASLVTLLGLLLPHQAEVETLGLGAVVVGTAALAMVLVAAKDRLPVAAYGGVIALGWSSARVYCSCVRAPAGRFWLGCWRPGPCGPPYPHSHPLRHSLYFLHR